MKRTFLILCLITICNISYADIASVGYVDSVADTKQDTITDIETIRSGAAAGATAVQPSSLSTVATSGSYNDLSNKPTIPTVPTTISSFTNDSGYITNSYHDSTKQDKLPNVSGYNGKYKLVWNNGLLGWELEPFSLLCLLGKYDLGFSQCIDPATEGTAYGFMNDSTGEKGARSSKTDVYGLTTDQTWGTTLYTGDNVTGIASCNSTPGTFAQSTTQNFNQTDKGQNCWCKMTFPAVSLWVFEHAYSSSSVCADRCAEYCGYDGRDESDFRSAVFSSVGQ
ncbi:MAG: hypothetical protein MJ170_04285 [Alphaproteobacteria bacterium]|nr:hypothetical protein [Alphaproteobacteria bacterium]